MKLPKIRNPFEKFKPPSFEKMLPAIAVVSPIAAGVALIQKNPEGFKKNLIGLHDVLKKDVGDLAKFGKSSIGSIFDKLMLPLAIGGALIVIILLKK